MGIKESPLGRDKMPFNYHIWPMEFCCNQGIVH